AMTLVMEHSAIVALGYFGTSEQVGVFTIAVKLSLLTSFILASINSIVAPKFAELYWGGKLEDLRKVIRFSSKTIFWTSAPVLLVLLAFPVFFMGVFGEGFRSGWLALMVLSVGQFVNSACGSVGYFLLMTNGQRALMNIISAAALLNIVLCILLVPAIGIVGASVASTATLIFWNITALIYIRLKYGISTFYLPLFSLV
ncbi:MAG: polysaccharide biosynthesis C-terminal domain-containing protein, partial [Thermodesulfobacteriota bacterium]